MGDADAVRGSVHDKPSGPRPTRGPWSVTEHRFGSERWTSYFVHAGIATVAAMNGPCLLYDNAEADARLIAAAPDYDAAAREMVAAIQDWRTAGQPNFARINDAQAALLAAIAKTDGR